MFEQHLEPAVQRHLPALLPELSAGIVGSGSEVLGFDDHLSQDHSWGPGSCKFLLPPELLESSRVALKEVLSDAVPGHFMGISVKRLRPDDIQVMSIDECYQQYFERPHPPSTIAEWVDADPSDLHYASRGSVIHDPSRALGRRIQEFRDAWYPTDVWKWRVASHLWRIWHFGDYNSFGRLSKRRDGVGLLIGQGHCVADTMRLICLLNREFPVFWKWLHRQYQMLPRWVDETYPFLKTLEGASDVVTRGEAIRDLCEALRGILCEVGLMPDRRWRNFMASKDVSRQIEDEIVRRLIAEREGQLATW